MCDDGLTPILPDHCLLLSSRLFSVMLPELLACVYDTEVPSVAENTTGTCSLHFDKLWVSPLAVSIAQLAFLDELRGLH